MTFSICTIMLNFAKYIHFFLTNYEISNVVKGEDETLTGIGEAKL